MRAVSIGILAALTVLCGIGSAASQSFEVGPGGVRVYPNGQSRVYEERRVYDDRPRYYEERRYDRGGGGLCAQLRAACEYGERGEGNCRRYRRTCD